MTEHGLHACITGPSSDEKKMIGFPPYYLVLMDILQLLSLRLVLSQ